MSINELLNYHCGWFSVLRSMLLLCSVFYTVFPFSPFTVSLNASEADNIDIVSICLQIKEKVFHEAALLQAREPGAKANP